MEFNKLRISPEDDARLRELLEIYESEIDILNDDELIEAEQNHSRQLLRFVKQSKKPKLWRFRIKASGFAIIAAAAAVLFIRWNVTSLPAENQIVSKGTGPSSELNCETSVVEADGATPPFDGANYQVQSGKISYLKLKCGRPVFVHLGLLREGTLYLHTRNLTISANEKLVVDNAVRLNFTDLIQKNPGLIVLVTASPLASTQLSAAEQKGLWMDEVPIKILP